eukprot:GILK01006099.1.p1 GENE.GILK01006099.1~~GILK01006099.1.p1  ORF type:complete len:511 (+),score=77.51 GILK01006099.1:67-1599(+)
MAVLNTMLSTALPATVLTIFFCQIFYNPHKLPFYLRVRRSFVMFFLGSFNCLTSTIYYMLYTMNTKQVHEKMNTDADQYSWVVSCGIFGLIVGYFAGPSVVRKFNNSRLVMGVGIISMVMCTSLMGLLMLLFEHDALVPLCVLFLLHNAVWPLFYLGATKIVGTWYFKKEKGIFGSLWDSLNAMCFLLASLLGSFIPEQTYWVFFLPAAALCGLFLLTIPILREFEDVYPEESKKVLELIEYESAQSELHTRLLDVESTYVLSPESPEIGSKSTVSDDSGNGVLSLFNSVKMWFLLGIAFSVGLLRDSFLVWYSSFLHDTRGISTDSDEYKTLGSILSLCSILGPYLAGFTSDMIFKSNRKIVLLLYGLAAVVVTSLFYHLPAEWMSLVILCGSVQTVASGTVSILTSTIPFDYGSKQGLVLPVIAICIYSAAILAGRLVGSLISSLGYNSWIILNNICACCVVVSAVGYIVSEWRWLNTIRRKVTYTHVTSDPSKTVALLAKESMMKSL